MDAWITSITDILGLYLGTPATWGEMVMRFMKFFVATGVLGAFLKGFFYCLRGVGGGRL